jgi:hypothetical protein
MENTTMTKKYCVTGKPLDIVKREAKDLKKQLGDIQLTEAKDIIARSMKHKDWQDLVEQSFDIADDFTEHFCLTRKSGIDEVCFDLSLLDDLLTDDDYRLHEELPEIAVLMEMECGMEQGTVTATARLIDREESSSTAVLPFKLDTDQMVEDYTAAIAEARFSGPSVLIGLMYDSGLFDINPMSNYQDGEFEAFLTLKMRSLDRIVAERILFNHPRSPKITEIIDWNRRCFAHRLEDGDIIISNGNSDPSELALVMYSENQYKTLVEEMEAELGHEAYTTQKGEIWMHDKTLLPIGEPMSVPDM